MKDIYKTKKQLISELEKTRTLLAEKSPEELKADVAAKGAPTYGDASISRREKETLVLTRKAIDSATDAIALSDPEGHHIYHNAAFTRLFEYTVEELGSAGGGQAVFALDSIGHEVFGEIMGGGSWSGEVEMRAKSGRMFVVLLHADAVKDDEGRIIGLLCVFTDITERKRLEYQLRKKNDELQLILDSIPAYVFYKDQAGRMLNVNKATADLAYVPREELLDKTVFNLLPDTAEKYDRDDMEVIESGQPKTNIEESLELPSGLRWLKTDKLPVKDDDGNTIGLLGFSVDITELKSTQEELREKEALLRTFFNSPGLICGIVELENDDIRYITVNSAMAAMYGLTPEDFSNKLAGEIGTDRGIEEFFIDNYGKSQKEDAPVYFEYSRGTGTETQWLLVTATFLGIEPTKRLPRFAYISSDITERRRFEEALRESEEKLRSMFSSMADGVVVTDIEGRITDVNETQIQMFGYKDKGELLGKGGFDFLVQRERGKAIADLFQVYEKGFNPSSTYVVVDKSGREFECEISTALLHDAAGKPNGTVSVMRDVSERRRMEEALRESEEKLRVVFDSIGDAVTVVDLDGNIVDANREALHLHGFKSKEDIIGRKSADLVAPKDRDWAVSDAIRAVKGSYQPEKAECKLIDTSGNEFDAEYSLAVLGDEKSRPAGFIGVARDISERKRAEEALRDSEERFRGLVENASDIIFSVDTDGNITYLSPSVESSIGYKPEELIGLQMKDLVIPEDMAYLAEDFARTVGGEQSRAEFRVRAKDGTVRIIETSSRITTKNGEPTGLIGVGTDVTARRQAEEALRNSEEKLRVTFDSMMDSVVVSDKNIHILDVNKTALDLLSIERKEELIGRNALEFIVFKDQQAAVANLANMFAEGRPQERVEYGVVLPDGRDLDVEVSTAVINDSSGNIVGFVNVIRDISERKKAQEALGESEAKHRFLTEKMTDIVWTTKLDFYTTYVSPSITNLLGYTPEERLLQPPQDQMTPESFDRVMKLLAAELEREGKEGVDPYRSVTVEVEYRNKNGSTVWMENSVSAIRDDQGRAVGLHGVSRDITDRKKVEEALRESEAKYRFLTEKMTDVVWTTNMDIHYTYISPSVIKVLGYTPEERMLQSLQERMTPESYDYVTKLLADEVERDGKEGVDPNRTMTLEAEYYHKNGSTVWLESYVSAIRDDQGRINGLHGVSRDITDRRKAEEGRREQDQRLRAIIENAWDGITILDENYAVTFESPSLARITGYTEHEWTGAMAEAFLIHPDDLPSLLKVLEDAKSVPGSVTADFTARYRHKDGSWRWMEATGKNLLHDPKVKGIVVNFRDVTERKQAEEEREKLMQQLDKSVRELNCLYGISNILARQYDTPEQMFQDILVAIVSAWEPLETVCARIFSEGTEHRTENFRETPWKLSGAITAQGEPAGAVEVYYLEEVVMSDDDPSLEVGRDIVNSVAGRLGEAVERKWARDALRESEEKYRNLVERERDVIVSVDALGFVTSVNSAVTAWGYEPDEFKEMNFLDLIAPEWREVTAKDLQERLLERGEHIGETMVIRKDGEQRPIEYSAVVIEEGGRYSGAQAIVRDISERKRAEEAIEAKERYFRAITDLSSGAALVIDSGGKVVDITGGLERLSGHTREKIIGMSAVEYIHPEDTGKAGAAFDEALRNPGKTIVLEGRLKNAYGEWQWTESMVTNLLDHRDVHGIVNHLVDITERKRSEEALRESQGKLSAVFDTIGDVVVVTDLEGRVVDVNSSVLNVLGYGKEDIIGRIGTEVIAPEQRETIAEELIEAISGDFIGSLREYSVIAADGHLIDCDVVTSKLADSNGNMAGFVVVIRDVAERKKAEEEIKRHTKRVEELYGIAQTVSQSSTLDVMLGEALKKICAAMETEYGCVFMLDLDERSLKLRSHQGLSEDLAKALSKIALTEDGIDKIMQVKEPVTEIELDATVDLEKANMLTAEIGTKGIVAAPLYRGVDLYGFLVAFSSHERMFSGEDLDLLKAISDEISVGISNMMLLEKTMELSVTDELTGLYNRRYFFEMMHVEMSRSQRTNRPFSLVMIDLDGFKEYNDKYGHSNGDAVLHTFAKVVTSSVRKSDLGFRYGGDEFVLILPSADVARAKNITQRMRDKWQKLPLTQYGISGKHVGFSSGIAEYPSNAESADGLIFLADAALYQAKKKGYEDKVVSELRTLSTDIIDVATQDQAYALAATVDAKDPYTYGHSQRVAETAVRIGKTVGMSDEDLGKLHAAALLHDIGKVGVPDSILAKTGKLNPEEWELVKKHSAEGARILGYIKELSPVVPIVLHHHEWYDGSGYPAGIKGIEIPSGARITSVADAYDTMVTKRPYRDAITPMEACEELRRYAGTQFDPVIVNVWCKLVEEGLDEGE